MPAAGTRLGPYEIVAEIGAGGMGEVYRARDPRIGRNVAIKLLPPSFATDKERLRRFEQEARAAGALNHPNMLAVYDVGTGDGSPYLVTELLEGETLRKRLAGGRLPVRKATEYAIQIAHGLTAAHSKGIVHRDLKPENIFITKEGRVKILDFGLAKLIQPEASTGNFNNEETIARVTEAGIVVGTVSYMSPEQIRAQELDHRSDLFAFGAILYEMLSGKRPFHRSSNIETMNAILKEEPSDMSSIKVEVAPALDRIIRRCLEKDPGHRFQSTSDLAFALEALSVSSSGSPSLPIEKAGRKKWLYPFIFLSLAVVAFVVWTAQIGREPILNPTGQTRAPFSIRQLTFRNGYVNNARFSPDGAMIFYSAAWNGKPLEIFFARTTIPAEARSLGLQDADLRSVSSTGQLAVLLRSTKGDPVLAQMPFAGGSPRELVRNVTSADWSPDGKNLAVIRYDSLIEFPIGKELYRSANGMHRIRVSPKGDRIAFQQFGSPAGVFTMELSGKVKKLYDTSGASPSGIVWSPNGDEVWFGKRPVIGGNDGGTILSAVNLSGQHREILSLDGNAEILDIFKDGRILLRKGFQRTDVFWASEKEGKQTDVSWLTESLIEDISKDGHMLLIYDWSVGTEPVSYIRNIDAPEPVLLGEGSPVAFSPDGQWVLAFRLQENAIILYPTGPGQPRVLKLSLELQQSRPLVWFPDGRHILIEGILEGSKQKLAADRILYEVNIENGKAKQVSSEGFEYPWNRGVMTPDGKFLVGTGHGHKDKWYLYSMEKKQFQEPLGLDLREDPIQWGEDGAYLYFRMEDPAKIYRLHLRSGKKEFWKTIMPTDPTGADDLRVVLTPDAKYYAYSYIRELRQLFLIEGLK